MRFWTIVFGLAAVFNLAVGLPLLLAPTAFYAALGQPAPLDILSSQMVGLLVSVFGVGYVMVARDPPRNRNILWLGALGKTPLPLITWLSIQAGRTPMDGLWLTLVDLVFVTLFLVYLLRRPKAA